MNAFNQTPEKFFLISSQVGTITCKHEKFTEKNGEPNVKGQYRIERVCSNCSAIRIMLKKVK
jgi:hypothetical protein